MVSRRARLPRPARIAGFPLFSPARGGENPAQVFRANVLAFAIGCALIGVSAMAVLAPGAVFAAEPAGSTAPRNYAISAGRLGDVLAEFAATSGVQLVFDPQLLAGFNSDGLRGQHSVQEGFAQLLGGSGYEAVYAGNGRYTLRQVVPPSRGGISTLPAVTVTASPDPSGPRPYAGGQIARGGRLGMLGNRDVMDTPFSTTNFTAQAISDRQARTIGDVISSDPSVQVTAPGGGHYEQFMVRGFMIPNADISYGGLYGLLPRNDIAPEIAERIEVLKGPNALLNGMSPNGAIGGAINVEPKRATDSPITDITATYGSKSELGGHVDIGRRFGESGQFGVRFNGVYRNGDTETDLHSRERTLGVIGLDYRGERLRLSADIGHQSSNDDTPVRGITVSPIGGVPSAVKPGYNYHQTWEYARQEDTFGAIRAEYDLSDEWTAHAAFGVARGTWKSLYTNNLSTETNGNTNSRPGYQHAIHRKWIGEIGIAGSLKTGPVRHDINLALSTLYHDRDQLSLNFPGSQSNIYHASEVPRPDLEGLLIDPPKVVENTFSGVALADTMSFFGDRLQVTGGARLQRVKVDTFNTATGAKLNSYEENAVTPLFGIVVKPWPDTAFYANYIEGLAPGPIAPGGTNNAGQAFAPYTSKQFEVGVKKDFGNVLATLSAFQITQPSAFTDAGNNYVVDGEQRNRGVELSVVGEPSKGFRAFGGIMLLDATLTKTQNGINNGNSAIGTPRFRTALGAEWDVPNIAGLTLIARGIYTGSQYINNTNSQKIASFTRVDFGARYELDVSGTPIIIRAQLENAFNKRAWGTAQNGVLNPLAPRRFIVSTTFRF